MCFPNVQELQKVTFCVNTKRFYTKLGKNTNLTIIEVARDSSKISAFVPQEHQIRMRSNERDL